MGDVDGAGARVGWKLPAGYGLGGTLALLSAIFFGARAVVTLDDLDKHEAEARAEREGVRAECRGDVAEVWRELEERERGAYRMKDADRDAALLALRLEQIAKRLERLEGTVR